MKHFLVVKFLTNELLAQLPQHLCFNGTGGPWLDGLNPGISDLTVIQIRTIVTCENVEHHCSGVGIQTLTGKVRIESSVYICRDSFVRLNKREARQESLSITQGTINLHCSRSDILARRFSKMRSFGHSHVYSTRKAIKKGKTHA
jgi:hypothetical protein